MKSYGLFCMLLVCGGMALVQGQQRFTFPPERPTQIVDADIAWQRADAEG